MGKAQQQGWLSPQCQEHNTVTPYMVTEHEAGGWTGSSSDSNPQISIPSKPPLMAKIHISRTTQPPKTSPRKWDQVFKYMRLGHFSQTLPATPIPSLER